MTGGAPLNIITSFNVALVPPSGFIYGGSGTTGAHGATIFTSPDGVNLTLRVDGAVFPWTVANGSWGEGQILAVAHGGSTYMAGGIDENGVGHLETSPDAITWTPRSTGFGAGGGINALAYDGSSTWVAVGFTSSTHCQIQYSTNNGATWTTVTSPNFGALNPSIQLLSVTYGNGKFVAVGGTSAVTGNGFEIYTSPDGITWTRQAGRPHVDNNDLLESVVYGNGVYMAGGAYAGGSARAAIITSPDAVTWTDRPGQAFGSTSRVNSVSYADSSNFVAGGFVNFIPGPAVGGIMHSGDNGATWSLSTINTSFGIVNSLVCISSPPPPPPPLTPCQIANVLDGLGIQPTGAYSTRKLLSAYAGPALRVWRASDGHQLDIGFGADCSLDNNALLTFCAGTDCRIATWYDQSGNGNDTVAFAGSFVNSPQIVTAGALTITVNGHTAITGAPNWLTAGTAGVMLNRDQGAIFAVGNATSGGTPFAGISWQHLPTLCGSDSDFGGNGNMVGIAFAQNAATPVSVVPSMVSYRFQGAAVFAFTDMHAETTVTFGANASYAMRYNVADAPSVAKGYVNGGIPGINTNTTLCDGPNVNFSIGNGGNQVRNSPFVGTIAEVIAFGSELSINDSNTLGANQALYWGLPTWTNITT